MLRPRVTASRAVPTPTIPPPTTSTSSSPCPAEAGHRGQRLVAGRRTERTGAGHASSLANPDVRQCVRAVHGRPVEWSGEDRRPQALVGGRGGLVAALAATVLLASGWRRPRPGSRPGRRDRRHRPPRSPRTRRPGPPSEPGPRTASVVMGGDLLWHNTVWFSAAEDHAQHGRGDRYDFDPMFAAVKPLVESADVALCHEEVPFAAPGQQPQSYPVFAAPRAIAPWIASMGWDACTTASNHSWDQGFAGVTTTADLLEANGIPHIGTFRSRGRARPAGHPDHRRGRPDRRRRGDVRAQRLRRPRRPVVGGLADDRGARRPARPGRPRPRRPAPTS